MINLKKILSGKLHRFAIASALIIIGSFNISGSAAAPIISTVLAKTPLTAFEGIYQNKINTFSYFKITVKDSTLVAKQMDGDMQIVLTRKSELGFEMKDEDGDETIPVTFSKNDAGQIAQLLVGEKDTWIKVKEYIPVKELSLTADQLKVFAGKYQFEEKNDMFLQITPTATGLMLKQGWNGREIEFVAIGENDFLNKKLGFPLKFSRDSTGNVIKVLAFNRDMWDKVKE